MASRCCCNDGRSGYVAAIVWRIVHEERPRTSTSGGQSEGVEVAREDTGLEAEGAVVVGLKPDDFIMFFHAALDVHVLHLESRSVCADTVYQSSSTDDVRRAIRTQHHAGRQLLVVVDGAQHGRITFHRHDRQTSPLLDHAKELRQYGIKDFGQRHSSLPKNCP